jgi:hypothetical protein
MPGRIGSVLSALAFSAALLAHTHPARAQDKSDVLDEETQGESSSEPDYSDDEGGAAGGFHFGLRLAYGIPMGDVTGSQSTTTTSGGATTTVTLTGAKMSDLVTGQIPIWVDLGWQATRSFMVGGYFSYGFVILASDVRDGCNQAGQSCSAGDIRTGLQAQFSFNPGGSVDPWLGAGFGYEWLRLKSNAVTTLRGWEIPMLEGGLDFPAGTSYVGPFVAFSMCTYSKADSSASGSTVDLPNTASHQWLFLGVRGVVK